VAEANFSETCENIMQSPQDSTILKANCRDEQGNLLPTSISMNDHIGRDPQGRLVWQQDGHFQTHCRKSHVAYDSVRDMWLLKARCTVPNGGHMTSDLNLDERIVNQNGALTYVAP
jgi:CVNH domain